ncbi:hypothetical protein L7F22_021369 [Adiantum nelumboides]|nr:hypothetical protein [Adiantum nelumboides]
MHLPIKPICYDQDVDDGVVGDFTIMSRRLEWVDFTQPYMASNLDMLTSYGNATAKEFWIFLKPFSKELWYLILFLFFNTAIVIFLLEHSNPNFHRQGTSMNRQIADASSKLGRFTIMFWLITVLVITNSYGASMSSILTTNHLTPRFQSFSELLTSHLPIGYQNSSTIRTVLQNVYHVYPSNMVPLSSEKDYVQIMRDGRVAAVIDEAPYLDVFLSSKCGSYVKVGNIRTLGGFGFAFRKNSSLTNKISRCILELEESGELQNLKNHWTGVGECRKQDSPNQMSAENFRSMFLILGFLYIVCLVLKAPSLLRKALRKRSALAKVSADLRCIVDPMLEYDLAVLTSSTFTE